MRVTEQEALLQRSRELKETLYSGLRRILPTSQAVALVDVPNHPNGGDSAILCGELAWLQDAGHTVQYIADQRSYNAAHLRALHPDGPILLHGGGNLGNWWPNHQRVRFQVLADFPDRLTVQLPQSVMFSRDEAIAEARRHFHRHGNLVVCAREQLSYDRCRDLLDLRAELLPDMAFSLSGSLASAPAPARRMPNLVLARTDGEEVDTRFSPVHGGVEHTDWPDAGHTSRAARLATRLLSRATPALPDRLAALGQRNMRFIARLASARYGEALTLVRSTEALATDRLHGTILAALAGVPHCLVNNKTGKVASFHRTWLADCAGAGEAGDFAQALALLAVGAPTR